MSLPGWSDAAQAQLSGSTVRPSVMLRIDATTGPLRLWGGVGPLQIPADAVESEPATYSGMGVLTGLPAVSQLANGLAERVEFKLSGVTPAIRALAADGADTVRGVSVRLGFMVFDADWQALSPVAWLWEGTADVVKSTRKANARTISLSVGSMFNSRRRPAVGYWTDAQQRERSADDAFCDHVAVYTAGTTRRFKPRS